MIVGNAAAAEYAGVAVSTWRAYVARGEAPEPEPERVIAGGHALPQWQRKRLDEWLARRPGKGGRPPKSTA
jgi:hypothetical protein